jgi:hypothetical protein
VFHSSLFVELCSGMSDASAIVLLGVLIGRSLATTSPPATEPTAKKAVVSVMLSWLAMRYLGYELLGFESGTNTLATFAWTAAMGAWISVTYLLLRPSTRRWPIGYFALVVFGIDWALYTAFVLIFVAGPTVGSVAARIAVDVIGVGIGTMGFEAMQRRQRTDRAGRS